MLIVCVPGVSSEGELAALSRLAVNSVRFEANIDTRTGNVERRQFKVHDRSWRFTLLRPLRYAENALRVVRSDLSVEAEKLKGVRIVLPASELWLVNKLSYASKIA